jgi:hypothetical protein
LCVLGHDTGGSDEDTLLLGGVESDIRDRYNVAALNEQARIEEVMLWADVSVGGLELSASGDSDGVYRLCSVL